MDDRPRNAYYNQPQDVMQTVQVCATVRRQRGIYNPPLSNK